MYTLFSQDISPLIGESLSQINDAYRTPQSSSVVSSCSDEIGTAEGAIHVPEYADLYVEVQDPIDTDNSPRPISVRTTCDDATSELSCTAIEADEIKRFEYLSAGLYYLFIERGSREDTHHWILQSASKVE